VSNGTIVEVSGRAVAGVAAALGESVRAVTELVAIMVSFSSAADSYQVSG
jgi:hypothetical protein